MGILDAENIRYCGICCGGFSVFAMVFLLSVGGIISSGSEIIEIPHGNDAGQAASTCYYGALIYFFTFLASIGCFFGPMFIRRGSDLDQLRSRSNDANRGRMGGRYEPQDL